MNKGKGENMQITTQYKEQRDKLLTLLKTEWEKKTLFVLPESSDIEGNLKDIIIFNDIEEEWTSNKYRLCLCFDEGTAPLYYREMSKEAQKQLITLEEETLKFEGALKIEINEGPIKLYNVKPAKFKEYLRFINAIDYNRFLKDYTNNAGFIELWGQNKEDIKLIIKMNANQGGLHD